VRAKNPRVLQRAVATTGSWKQGLAARLRVDEWQDSPHFAGVLIVSIVTTLFITIFYINEPFPPSSLDTPSYLTVAEKIKNHFTFTDVYRTPGYPLFIAIVFLIFGDGDIRFVSVAQAALYLIAAIELYVIAYLIFRRVWVATAVALIASVNTFQFSFAKGILVEGFSMWTVVTLALTIVLFFRKPSARAFWLVAGVLLFALMTRTEWMYVAVPLFALLVISTRSLGMARRLGLHAVGAIAIFYSVLGLYVYACGPQNGYGPFVVIPRIVALGKVFQYRMQDDAPSKYAVWTRRMDRYLASENRGPYDFALLYPAISADFWKLGGSYARATITNAPGKYLWKTIRFADSANKYRWGFGAIHQNRVFAGSLNYLQTLSTQTYSAYRLFPLFAVGCLALWLFALFRWTGYHPRINMIAALAFLGLYQLFVVTAGGYDDWPRLYMTLNPSRILLVFGPTLVALGYLGRIVERRALPFLSRRGELVWWAWVALVAVVVAGFAAFGFKAGIGPITWDSREWLRIHPARTIVLVTLAAWITLLTYRARRAAAVSIFPEATVTG
jgi:hypothetical protein